MVVPWLVMQTLPPVTTEMLVVFAIIVVALVLFVVEPVPIDIVAIGLIVALVVFEPWTQIGPTEGLSGFASTATITVLAMFVLSEGVRQTGVVKLIGDRIVGLTGDSPRKQLAAIVGLSGSTAGFINNTPVVAIMIPMTMNIARQTGISPSRLLMPLSFASMMGGMLTLIGTSTNILASDVSARLLDRPFSMFEFTLLGFIVLVVGSAYLLVVAPYLIPERIKPDEELTEEFEIAEYLAEVVVRPDSPLVGRTVAEAREEFDMDLDIVQVIRLGKPFMEPLARKEIQAGDVLMVRTGRDGLIRLLARPGLEPLPTTMHDEDLESGDEEEAARQLVEVVVTPDASIVGYTLDELNFGAHYDATVLAIRRGGQIRRERMGDRPLRGGDTLLLQATEETVTRLDRRREFVVVEALTRTEYRTRKLPIAIGIVAAVVAFAALDILPIVISALAGIVAMVATGCVRPSEVYDAVDWNVIFLLAGVIPLGIALEETGGAALIAALVVESAELFAPIVVLGIFYLVTSLLTNVISNNASVVLMIPVAVDAAAQIDANAFAFVLAVTFAASTAFMTPVGYQTNLMVYAPGGYTFADFFRVGAPLQLLLAVVTPLGIAFFWGL
jgi:di/tricarboxylate transporter